VSQLRSQLAVRGPRYEEADLIIDVEQLSVQSAIDAAVAYAIG
jgi:hypothetical protein